ncbi:LTA synthase family protein [Alloscardovia venturai]|uniref:LTA synthase family protein n=1 Tax=Alloscardovia venturai TaxID=1769421 RepID=A0ABW2Y2W3_9BIFI
MRVRIQEKWSYTFSRHNYSKRSYALWFFIINLLAVVILQWGINDEHAVLNSWGFVGNIFRGKYAAINEFLLVGVVYFILLMLINRFWLTSGIFFALCIVITVAERFKMASRAETILPADMNFISGGNAGNLLEWMPSDAFQIILGAVILVIVWTAFMMVMGHRDTRGGVVRLKNVWTRTFSRIASAAVAIAILVSFVLSMSSIGGWSHGLITFFGDSPKLWDSKIDAQNNGTAIGFARLLNPKIMDKPQTYSETTMKKLAAKYSKRAQETNVTRTTQATDSTVIYLLSESFSDPSRVPGLKLNKDVIPRIRTIKENTTSGYMLSSGYGGGTANLEYMALTGMSMVNFAPSLSSPYQQLVPNASWTPTLNQLWKSEDSLAFHPYLSNMYSRNVNYKKFGFSKFYTLDKPYVIQPQNTLGTSKYVDDQATYTAVLNSLKKDKNGQSYFYQVATMQNHMPYKNWYPNNDIEATSTNGQELGKSEKQSIETYAKGAQYTDTYTKAFLDSLDKLNRPITVVFYGDHLPGAYKTAAKDENNSVALHETDYFIWSNKASNISNEAAKKAATNSAYTSPNFFQAQLFEHMNAKVSPFIEFLDELHARVPAMEPAVVNKIQGWARIPEGQALYLNNQGKYIDVTHADAQTRQLLEDYKLIQYDVTAGKHYLKNLDFMDIAQ